MDPYNYEGYGQCDLAAPDFRSVVQVGTRAPGFTLTDLDGRTVSLGAFKGKKHVLLRRGKGEGRSSLSNGNEETDG
jgi:hypothetical protein